MELDQIAQELAQQYNQKQECRKEQLRQGQQRYRDKARRAEHNARLEAASLDPELQQRLRQWEEDHGQTP